jgi:zinc transport system substrate-binding protein
MRRVFLFAMLAIAVIVVAAFTGFYLTTTPSPTSLGLKVLATFYPLYDFAKNVGGDKINASILVPETVDVHDFDPAPSDIQNIATADVLIYNGAGLEKTWLSNVISASGNTKLVLVDTSQNITLLAVAPQFQSGGRTVDSHFWLDPVLVKQQVSNILQGLIQADPTNSQYFTQNAEAYKAKLDSLHSQIVAVTTSLNIKTRYFVTFHEAFAYFAKEYNLTQIPIAGPFQEEPTVNDIQNVINAIQQYHLLYVGYESLENPAIPQSISAQTNATLIQMDPIEGLTVEEKAAGKDYISLIQETLANLELALYNVGS